MAIRCFLCTTNDEPVQVLRQIAFGRRGRDLADSRQLCEDIRDESDRAAAVLDCIR
jgi:hypothetical protein